MAKINEKLNICFSVSGAVKQQITILNGEKPENFFKKIKQFRYLTSISGSEIMDVHDNFKIVGTIDDQNTTDETEYFDFEME